MLWYTLEELSDFPDNADAGGVFFLEQDLSEISLLLRRLEITLNFLGDFSSERKNLFLTLVEEITTNAIKASASRPLVKYPVFGQWKVKNRVYTLRCIDQGPGLFLSKSENAGPDLGSILGYQKSHVIELLKSGRPFRYTGSGQGLKILRKLSDQFNHWLITENGELRKEEEIGPNEQVTGTCIVITLDSSRPA